MPLEDLRDLIALLEVRDELRRVRVEVDPELEIAAVTDRVCKREGGGKALLFEKVKGHPHSVATNLFGSARRAAWALEAEDLAALQARMAEALARQGEVSAEERLHRLAAGFRPRRVERPVCRQIVADPDLRSLPALRNWPEDGGPFLTLPLVFTRDPESGRINCGMYRMQIFDAGSAGLHWGEGADGARHAAAWARRGERMPVAVALGGPPALIYAAAAPLPEEVEEGDFAGWLRGEPVPMTHCLSSDLEVPATAEFVLEGYVEPGEQRMEGPFGNHTGFYAPPAPVSVLRLRHLSHRPDPLCPCTVVGPPPMENLYLGRITERLFLPLLQSRFPEIADLHFLAEGVYHGCALVAVHPEAAGRGLELLRELWGTRLLGRSRLLVAVDADIDPAERPQVLWRLLNQVDPVRDVATEGGRTAIDATEKEGRRRVQGDPSVLARVAQRWGAYGIA